MMTSPYKRNILERDVKQRSNKQTNKTYLIRRSMMFLYGERERERERERDAQQSWPDFSFTL